MEEEETSAIIPEKDFREAITACCEDPQLRRYFRLAPPGAKLFIGLGFYSTHFGDNVDQHQYAECQAQIEPALTVTDLKYLIRFEATKVTKRYLRQLLACREDAGGGDLTCRPTCADVDALSKQPYQGAPVNPPDSWRGGTLRATHPHMGRLAGSGGFPYRVVALIAVLIGGGVFLVANWGRVGGSGPPDSQPPSVSEVGGVDSTNRPICADAAALSKRPYQSGPADRGDLTNRPHGEGLLAGWIAPNPSESHSSGALRATRPTMGVAATASSNLSSLVSALPPPATQTRVPESEIQIPEPGDPTPKPQSSKSAPSRYRRVVFTDGRKIVRHPGGKVEVPRVFSCAGAGIKSFWVYGPNPEADAEKERRARREWMALVKQARAEDE